MNKRLLTTTALVAVFAVTNALALDLPSDATNLTTGDYVVSHTGNPVSHTGNIKISEDATLVVKTYADVDIIADTADPTNAFVVFGDVEVGDATNGGGVLTVANDEGEKPFMSLAGKLTINDGATVNLLTTGEEAFSTILANSLDIKGGTVNLNYGDIFIGGAGNISGGDINIYYDSTLATTGALVISGGTLTGFTEGSIRSNTLNISGGTINWTGGEILGETSLTMTGGTLNLNNVLVGAADDEAAPGSYTAGSIALNGGVVNVNGGAGNTLLGTTALGGTLNISNGSTLSTYGDYEVLANDDVVFGSKGNIATTGSGVINLAGNLLSDVSGTGTLAITNSNAVVNGDVSGVDLDIKSNVNLANTFKGSLTAEATTLYSNNTLDLGTKTLTTNSFTVQDNATVAFTITDKTQYGKIDATTINVSTTGTNLNLMLNSAALAKDETATFNILNGTVSGAFANLSENSRYTFVDNGDGTFDVTGEASASDVVQDAGGTTNNAKTAEAWDSVNAGTTSNPTTAAVANALATLSNSATVAGQQAYIEALTSLAPDTAPSVQATSIDTASQVFGAVGTRLSGGSIASAVEGKASGDSAVGGVTAWVQTLFNKTKLDDTSKAKGFDSDSTGLALGFEKQLSSDVKAGIGYAYSKTDIDGFNRTTDVDTHTGIIYGEYKPSNWYVNSVATYSFANYDEKKNVAGVQVKGDYDVDTIGLQAMTGYDIHVNSAILTPETGLRYLNVKQKSFTDTAGQNVSANSSDILTGVVGAKLSKDFALNNGMNIRPEIKGALTYDLVNDDASSVVTLANGSSYVSQSEALKKFGMEFGASVTADVTDRLELSVGYEGAFRKNFDSHTGLLNMKYKF